MLLVKVVPVNYYDTPAPAEVLVCVEPQDAIEVTPAGTSDAEGWCAAFWSYARSDTYAYVKRERARQVDYRVSRVDKDWVGNTVRLIIEGYNDSTLLVDAYIDEGLTDVFTILLAVPFVIWLVWTVVERRRKAKGLDPRHGPST